MRGFGSFGRILKQVLLYVLAGPIALVMGGGGGIMGIVMTLILAPILGPHIKRMLGVVTTSVAGMVPGAA